MSYTKRILFGNLPQDDTIRSEIAQSVRAAIEPFTVRAHNRPRQPKRDLAGRTRDPFWEGALDAAIRELGIDHRNINGVPRFRKAEDRDRAHEMAVLKWNTRWEKGGRKLNQPLQPIQIASRTSTTSNPRPSAPFILDTIPPDPYPTDDELKPYLAGNSGVLELDRFIAERKWRDALIEQNENTFLVPFIGWMGHTFDYKVYLRSSVWKAARNKVLDKAGRKCACCPRRATQVHHRDYRPRVLAGQDLSPLVPVCTPCHDLIEGYRSKSWQNGEAKLAELVDAENQRLADAGRQPS